MTLSTRTSAAAPAVDSKEAAVATPSHSDTLVIKGGTTDSSSYEEALALECPQPELTAEHNEQGIKTSCCARFSIDENGKFDVRLVSSTGSQEVDDIAISTLRRWKFKPAQLNGKAVKSNRKIKIEFEIE
jgi:protein TonB